MKRTTILRSGRPRTSREELFTAALMAELDIERDRRSMDQRSFAHYLVVHESLLSMYRAGQRLPSIPGFIEMERKLPGLLGRVVRRYYHLAREYDAREAAELDEYEYEEETEAGDGPATSAEHADGAREAPREEQPV